MLFAYRAGCRNMVLQQVGSYLGYSGRGAKSFGKAARDPGVAVSGERFSQAANRLQLEMWLRWVRVELEPFSGGDDNCACGPQHGFGQYRSRSIEKQGSL
jgi:hypothetical protein